MEDEISKTSKTPIMPALGVLGLGIGVIALALAITAIVKVGDSAEEMTGKIEKAAALSLEMKKASDRIDAIASQLEGLKSGGNTRVDALAKQTQTAIENIGKAINDTRAAIQENRKAIEELAKRAAPVRETLSPVESAVVAGDEAAANAGDRRIHKIQGGDTFAKLAGKYNTTIDAIVKANPSLNPARLQIGQEVVIP